MTIDVKSDLISGDLNHVTLISRDGVEARRLGPTHVLVCSYVGGLHHRSLVSNINRRTYTGYLAEVGLSHSRQVDANWASYMLIQSCIEFRTIMTASNTVGQAKKSLILNAFVESCSGHQSPGLWRHPDDRSWEFNKLKPWVELAKMLEDAKFHGIFIADVLGSYDSPRKYHTLSSHQAGTTYIEDRWMLQLHLVRNGLLMNLFQQYQRWQLLRKVLALESLLVPLMSSRTIWLDVFRQLTTSPKEDWGGMYVNTTSSFCNAENRTDCDQLPRFCRQKYG